MSPRLALPSITMISSSSKPLTLGVELELHGVGSYRTVKSTEDAARCLLEHWPRGKGKAYMAAQQACLEALEGVTSPELARPTGSGSIARSAPSAPAWSRDCGTSGWDIAGSGNHPPSSRGCSR